MSDSNPDVRRDVPPKLLDLADELEQFPLGNCGPSDDPDKQTAYLYSFREIAKRFVAAVRRLKKPEIDAELTRLNLNPDFITEAYDLKAELVPIIDRLREETTTVNKPSDDPSPLNVDDGKPEISAFISYSSVDKSTAAQVKSLLEKHGISGFLAHDDIQVSEEWKNRILAELKICEVFVPILSKNFRASDWASQEIGSVVLRQGVAIVPLQIDDTVPYGFISHLQGRRIPTDGPTFDLVILPLVNRFPRTILPPMIRDVENARSYRGAEAAMRPLVNYFPLLTNSELLSLVDASINNGQVWNAQLCHNQFLPKLLATEGPRIPIDKREILKYQIEKQQWFPVH